MRTQLRRQAAAHADHLRDVLRIQEQELNQQFDQVGVCFIIVKRPFSLSFSEIFLIMQ